MKLFFYVLMNCLFSLDVFGAIDYSIPIYYHSETPAIKILVGGEEKLVVIDTGAANLVLSLKKEILQKFGTKTAEVQRFKDVKGEEFKRPIWMLHEFSAANVKFENVKTLEYTEWGLNIRNENITSSPEAPLDGLIGLKFFEGKKVILDFEKNKMQFVDSFSEDIELKNWIHFSNDFEFHIQLDDTKFKSVLDTGANMTFILKSSIPSSFPILLCDFEMPSKDPWYYIQPKNQQTIFKPIDKPWRLFVMQFQEPDVDIIIGMDSLKGKKLFLDCVDKKYFITDSPQP